MRSIPFQASKNLRFQQILLNLLSNAIKFTQNGIVRVEVRDASEDVDGLTVLRCAVSDTGIGIPEDKVDVIFDRFTQAHRYQSQASAGTGLGLSIVKRLVQAMGGDIAVESKEGEGSLFTFTVRMQLADTSTLDDEAQLKCLKPNSPCCILVVEDNHINQLVIKRLLEKQGHRVTLTNNGQEAISALRQARFDCVFMDVEMPVMGGIEATGRIRSGEAAPHNPNVPIVALTAHAIDGDRQRFLATGMNEYMTKPVDGTKLFEILKHVVARA